METKGTTTKGLARTWRPDRVETTRRMLQKYLAGDNVPEAPQRDEIAAALRVPVSMLPLPSDDISQADMFADLMATVRRLEQKQDELLRFVHDHEEHAA